MNKKPNLQQGQSLPILIIFDPIISQRSTLNSLESARTSSAFGSSAGGKLQPC